MIGARAVWELPEEKAKARGMARAASANYRNVQLAREVARDLARDGRAISMDQVREAMLLRHPEAMETEPGRKRNWLGSVWNTGEWVAVGLVKSNQAGAHRNLLRQWKLKEQGQ